MATIRARWLLSILLFSPPHWFANAGAPAPPSDPECFIPCDEKTCEVDIFCTWDPRLDHQYPSNYSLHWETANSVHNDKKGYVISETKWSGSIYREQFPSHEELHVWVKANNQLGSVESQKVKFSTEDITKPFSPTITLRQQEPLDIEWNSVCNQDHLSLSSCELQYRTKENPVWNTLENGFIQSYAWDDSEQCTVYEFQVRCACTKGKTSDWSKIFSFKPLETAPVGELDIWMECGLFTSGFDCLLIWKQLPTSQACGHIMGYEAMFSYNNGTVLTVNVSTEGPSNQLVCYGMLCYLNSSLKDVSSVSVSAYNAHGATAPAHLAVPVSGEEKSDKLIFVKMDERNLTVSWNLTSNLIKSVVQYKQVGCPPGQGFDWIKVNKSETVFFEGRFNKFTPYNLSLFTVTGKEVHHFYSQIVYSFEGTPPRVRSFKVVSIAATQVTLSWEPIPLSENNGVIQFYQIGVNGRIVHSVTPSPKNKSYTFDLTSLIPEQDYEVSIRAVTAAGPGENVTKSFKTKQEEINGQIHILLGVLSLCLIFGICYLVFSLCRAENKACQSLPRVLCAKVPDPRNSQIFRNMKHQINDPLAWLCKPTYEPHPKIVVLEVVELQPGAFKSPLKKTSNLNGEHVSMLGDECSKTDCQDDQKEDVITEGCDKTDHNYEREEYSKMVDSDEEKDRDDCSDSSGEEDFTSGYEKHFMPSALEILEVS